MPNVKVDIENLKIQFVGLNISPPQASRIFSLALKILNSKLQAEFIENLHSIDQNFRLDKIPPNYLRVDKTMNDGRIAERLAEEIITMLTNAVNAERI